MVCRLGDPSESPDSYSDSWEAEGKKVKHVILDTRKDSYIESRIVTKTPLHDNLSSVLRAPSE